MTATSASAPAARRWRSWRWVLPIMVAITAVAAASAYLTAERPGGRMDPDSTGAQGAHALVALLRSHGVQVVVANTVDDVERAAGRDTLVLVAQTQLVTDRGLLLRVGSTPGDLLLVEPTSRARAALTPGLRSNGINATDSKPDCDLREANQAGTVDFGPSNAFTSRGDPVVTRCYDGIVVRYRDGTRTVTVVGSTDFMTNSGLLHGGNAALAMNLAGARPNVVWYAPQHVQGEKHADAKLFDLIPDSVTWMVWQLCLVVLLLAGWKGRRIGPLVAEDLPVVVRASETVEGLGRLYRSRRARDRAARALRTATLQRLLPRMGLDAHATPVTIAGAVAGRSGLTPQYAHHTLFGAPPETDNDLIHLAHALDDIERQVAHL